MVSNDDHINIIGGGSGGYIYIKQIIDDPLPEQNFTYGQVIIKGKI